MKHLKIAATAGTIALCLSAAAALFLSVSARAGADPNNVTIWNGTTGTVPFTYENAAGPTSQDLQSNYRVVLPCEGSANLSIATDGKIFQAALRCGHSYGLYYDADKEQIVAKYIPTAAVAPPPDQTSPLRQLLDNQAAAAANRATLGITVAPK